MAGKQTDDKQTNIVRGKFASNRKQKELAETEDQLNQFIYDMFGTMYSNLGPANMCSLLAATMTSHAEHLKESHKNACTATAFYERWGARFFELTDQMYAEMEGDSAPKPPGVG